MASGQNFTLNIKALFDASDVRAKVVDIQKAFNNIKLPETLQKDFDAGLKNLTKSLNDFETRAEKGVSSKADAKGLTTSIDAVIKDFSKVETVINKIKAELGSSVDLSKIVKLDDATLGKIRELREEVKQLHQQISEVTSSKLEKVNEELDKIKSKGAKAGAAKAIELFKTGDIEGALKLLEQVETKQKQLLSQKKNEDGTFSYSFGETTRKTAEANIEAIGQIRLAFQQTQTEVSGITEQINSKTSQMGNTARQAAEGVVNGATQAANAFIQEGRAAENARSSIVELASGQAQFVREVDQLKSRIQYFFGLSNGINLVKRAIRGAVDTIKSLDKAMTETAVVTDFTVSDMWEQLPEYTKRANQLGVTTQAAYEAATLYYQQGLNTEEVNALSNETLKMARIAGLDAAEATDRMTNAIRGFNMEINQMNAQRIDDVYSRLAAISASDVDEISTAMTKVASLAHNANMEFETTSAFLAQIIETTRESAETAGTALKTVVARFSEVKKLVDEDQLKGQDEEGQVIDVNKVSQALRTAGIDLNKYFLGEVGLDDIFMELASKWDSLTTMQQRYIATQAAGSRQQSRFIALMSDYARMQELVGEAYNAEGASAKQFEKTQDSLESKLARLKNAWDQFLMGLTNNVMVKTVVDALTQILNLINKITGVFGEGAGTVLKWTAAIGTIGGLRRLFVDGGLLTQMIGGVMGNTPMANRLRVNAGLGTIDQGTGLYRNFSRTELQANRGTTLIGGLGGLGKKAWTGAKNLGAFFGFGQKGALMGGLSGAQLTGSAGLAAGLGGIATAALAVTAAVAAAYGVYQLWLHNSAEGKLKLAKKEAEDLQEKAQKTQDQLKSLNSLQDTYKEKTEQVDKATTEADQRKAIQDRNEAILSAIEQNGTLAQYVVTERTEFGIELTVNEESLSNAIENITKEAQEAAVRARFGEARVDFAEVAVAEKQLRKMYASEFVYSPESAYDLSIDEIYERLMHDSSLGDKNFEKVAELYSKIINERGSAEQQTKIAYADFLTLQGVSKDLTNALIPILSENYNKTRQPLSDEQLKSITNLGELSLLPVLNAYSGKIDATKSSLVNFNIDNEDALAQLLGLDGVQNLDQVYSNLETTLGLAEGSIKETIKANTQLIKQQQSKTVQKATAQMTGTGRYSIDTMARYLNLNNFDYQKYISGLLESLGTVDYGQYLVTPIIEAMEQGDWESSGFQEWVDSINFDNPIQGFTTLNKAAKDSTSLFHDIADAILSSSDGAAQFSASAQLGFLVTSESYDSLSESLGKFIEENGSITSANILELAESNNDLNALLENNIASAKGLAEVLGLIEKGSIGIWELSDAAIAAASAMDDLDGIVSQTIDDLNGFDPGFNENDVVSFINKAYETITKNLESGAVGNNQNRTYLEKIFGPDIFDFGDISTKEYGEKYEAKVNELVQILDQNKENMFQAWSDVASTFQNGAGEYNGLIEQVGNEIVIHAKEFGLNTEELIQVLQETTGLSDTWIRMMVTDFKNNSADFRYEMAQMDLPNAIEAWYEQLGSINGEKFFTQQDVDFLKLLFPEVNEEEIRNKIKDYTDKIQKELNEFDFDFNKDGKIAGKEYIRGIEQSGADIFSFDESTNPLINFDKLKQAFADAGLSSAFESSLNDCLKVGDHFVAQIGDQLTDIEIRAGETASSAYQRVFQESSNKQLAGEIGKQIAAALSGLGENQEVHIEFLPDTKAVDTYIATTKTAKGEVNWENIYPGPPTVDNLEREVHWKNTGDVPQDGGGQIGAAGGIVSSFASGSGNRKLKPGTALTGEEDPEIVWNKEKGYAYITGKQYPQFQNLQPGDRVFNAQETRKILKGSYIKYKLPSFATGYGDDSSSKSSNNVMADQKSSDDWKKDLDWLYNLMEDIAELERIQNTLSEKHDQYLEDIAKTGRDLYNLTNEQLNNLYTQRDNYQEALTRRLQEMREQITDNELSNYVWWNNEDQTIEIDWDAINEITDKDQYDKITDLISKAEKIQDEIDDAQDALLDINGQIAELEKRYLQEYIDLQKRVYDAVVYSYQQQIDQLTSLNETLDDSNSQILNSLQKEIELQRQIRDNTDTENSIKELEARLAFLRRDTSGANELEIKELEQQLEDARKDYTDKLIDQAIEKLEESNSEASEQRQKQIDLLTEQLDYWKEVGALWPEVAKLLDEGINGDGSLIRGSNLEKILQNAEEWKGMSQEQRDVWANELILSVNQAGAYLIKMSEGFDNLSKGIWALIPESSIPTGERPPEMATGGLNTRSGYAWLDGTANAPEYVLNARQTDAFLKLAEVLPSMFNNSAGTTNNFGGNVYVELNMSVGEIGSDYDVDRLIERMRDDIYSASTYRNVNVVSSH